ncbi:MULTISPECIES: retron system putative HNH endonuclease [unclassified Nostoc]|uniref:retron system putative HNH endonuclease n=1 Tax=unclassified Nostoc TaxID=2593658 RepID=UPI002FF7E74D
MKYIKKVAKPISLTKWNNNLGSKVLPWIKFKKSVKNDVFEALLCEQGYICCYCGASITRNECHIEHLKPKSIYPQLTYEYANLMVSCQGEDEKQPRVPVHCGHRKDNWYDEHLMVSPLEITCTDFFKYPASGEIQPTDEPAKKAAAETTIENLALNISKLQNMRRLAIDAALLATDGLTEAEIQLLAQGYEKLDANGQYTPFCAAISYFFKNYF